MDIVFSTNDRPFIFLRSEATHYFMMVDRKRLTQRELHSHKVVIVFYLEKVAFLPSYIPKMTKDIIILNYTSFFHRDMKTNQNIIFLMNTVQDTSTMLYITFSDSSTWKFYKLLVGSGLNLSGCNLFISCIPIRRKHCTTTSDQGLDQQECLGSSNQSFDCYFVMLHRLLALPDPILHLVNSTSLSWYLAAWTALYKPLRKDINLSKGLSHARYPNIWLSE